MSQNQIEILQRALNREKAARKEAEKILEQKSTQLYELNQKLVKSNEDLAILLAQTNSQLQGVFENIVDAYVIIDLQGNILKMNDAAVSLLGFDDPKEDFNLMKMVSPGEEATVQQAFKDLLTKGAATDLEIQIITKRKARKLVHINASVIYDEGIAVAAQGIVRDITKDKEAEEKLIESENRLSTVILNLDSGTLLEDEDRKIVLTNKKFCELFNIPVSPELLIGQDCSESAEQTKSLFQDPEGFVKDVNMLIKNKTLVLGDEVKMVCGKILERDYIPIFKKDVYKGHLWSYRDITLKRKYRESIEAQKHKYYNIISNMNLGLVEVDMDDRIIMVNQSMVSMTGYSKAELIGFRGKDFLPYEGDKEVIEGKLEKHRKGKSDSYEVRIRNKAGQIRYWSVSGAPNYDLNGNIVGYIGINYDITEIIELQNQKEKLVKELKKNNDELQEYAHVVSHDLKSPLRSIHALISWLKEDNVGKLDETSLRNIDLVETTLEKMEQLITDILDYSSVGADAREAEMVNINDLLQDLIKILYVPEHIEITLIKTLPEIQGNKAKLQQLFQNLISNAVKFCDKEEGLIEIDVLEKKNFYQFSVKDNGMGIEKKFHDKIFKIFHALNKSKDSTGIGLSIVKKIVDLHDGDIWLESEPNVGTTFYFTLKK
ncbi:PAS domain-containing sensor histidine kinase [Sediminibacter sp. Hel_I_10]|uniref:PAS domain-containing sensor histidine kinase n=1 Tax=Sediminibacter sp. Hel_I_10 TaxID=1392490 RepID=UPI00047C10C5|nr:PAS domain-containing sensor histidine kinase [Sediminibacter sp. Hel_I_10]